MSLPSIYCSIDFLLVHLLHGQKWWCGAVVCVRDFRSSEHSAAPKPVRFLSFSDFISFPSIFFYWIHNAILILSVYLFIFHIFIAQGTTTKTSKKGERFNEIVKKNVNNLQTIKNSNRKQYEFVYVSKHIFMETIQHSHWFIHNTLLLIARVFVFFVFVCCCWFEQRIEKEKQSAIFIQCLYSPMQNIFVSFELFLLYSIRLEQFSLE